MAGRQSKSCMIKRIMFFSLIKPFIKLFKKDSFYLFKAKYIIKILKKKIITNWLLKYEFNRKFKGEKKGIILGIANDKSIA